MRTLAVGDIHGCDTALAALLDHVRPAADDTVVILGDVVDRGPGSRQCVERLIALEEECRVVAVRGNHDEMMLAALELGVGSRAWQQYGGLETLESYGTSLDEIPQSHVQWLAATVDYWSTETELFVHANWDPARPADRQPPHALRWEHLSGRERPLPGRRVICGHTSQKDGLPKTLPGWVCIDTHAWGGQWLTALDVGSDLVYRANEAGQAEGPIPLEAIAVPFRRTTDR